MIPKRHRVRHVWKLWERGKGRERRRERDLLTPQGGMLLHALANSFISTNTVWRPGKSRRGEGRKKKDANHTCSPSVIHQQNGYRGKQKEWCRLSVTTPMPAVKVQEKIVYVRIQRAPDVLRWRFQTPVSTASPKIIGNFYGNLTPCGNTLWVRVKSDMPFITVLYSWMHRRWGREHST